MIYPMVPFPVTLSDPYPRLQGHGIIFKPIDALSVLCAQLTRDLLNIAKFLLLSSPLKHWRPSRKVCIFDVALYYTKNLMCRITWIDIFCAKICAKRFSKCPLQWPWPFTHWSRNSSASFSLTSKSFMLYVFFRSGVNDGFVGTGQTCRLIDVLRIA